MHWLRHFLLFTSHRASASRARAPAPRRGACACASVSVGGPGHTRPYIVTVHSHTQSTVKQHTRAVQHVAACAGGGRHSAWTPKAKGIHHHHTMSGSGGRPACRAPTRTSRRDQRVCIAILARRLRRRISSPASERLSPRADLGSIACKRRSRTRLASPCTGEAGGSRCRGTSKENRTPTSSWP